MSNENEAIYQAQIDYIMRDFNFERVKRSMGLLGLKWQGEAPSVAALKKIALDLLTKAANANRFNTTSSGGFNAVNWNGHLALEFVIEQSDTMDADMEPGKVEE